MPDASLRLSAQAWGAGGEVVVVELHASQSELERRIVERSEGPRAPNDASEADVAVLHSLAGARGPASATAIDAELFKPSAIAGMLGPLIDGTVPAFLADSHVRVHHSLQSAAEGTARGEHEHPDALHWRTNIERQIMQDAGEPEILQRWAHSTIVDGASGEAGTPRWGVEQFAGLAGVHCEWPVVHAGVAHPLLFSERGSNPLRIQARPLGRRLSRRGTRSRYPQLESDSARWNAVGKSDARAGPCTSGCQGCADW